MQDRLYVDFSKKPTEREIEEQVLAFLKEHTEKDAALAVVTLHEKGKAGGTRRHRSWNANHRPEPTELAKHLAHFIAAYVPGKHGFLFDGATLSFSERRRPSTPS